MPHFAESDAAAMTARAQLLAKNRLPRDERGHFFTRRCIDPNCDGELVPDPHWGDGRWRCNGLTHRGAEGPLEECTYMHDDGDVADYRVAALRARAEEHKP